MALPAYEPANALNFGPIQQGFNSIAQNALAQNQQAMEQQRLGMEQATNTSQLKSQALQQQAEQARLHGAAAQAILDAAPDQQPALAQQYMKAQPDLAKHIQNNGMDPNNIPVWAKAIRDEALGPQNPIDVEQKQAAIGASKAATAASVQATEAGKMQFSPTGEVYVNKNGEWKKQEEDGGGVVKLNADAIASGRQPPVFTNLGRGAVPAAVKAELERRGLNISELQNEWQRAQAQIKAVNSSQMTRYTGLYKSVDSTIDEANRLAEQMQLSGVPVANKLELMKYIQTEGNSPNGQLATQYVSAINTLKEEFANLAQGGFAPTEPAWELANQQINGNYGVKQLGASLGEVKRLAGLRYHGIPGIDTVGPDAANRYIARPAQGQPLPQQTAPAGAVPPAAPGLKYLGTMP